MRVCFILRVLRDAMKRGFGSSSNKMEIYLDT